MTLSVKVRSRDQTIREVGDDYVLQDGGSPWRNFVPGQQGPP